MGNIPFTVASQGNSEWWLLILQVHEVTSTDLYGSAFVVLLGYAVQWGIMSQKIKTLEATVRDLTKTVAERILPRQEYENRHKDLQDRVKSLEDTAFLRSRRFPRETEG